MRGALDSGRSMDDVLRSLRPPPHFKQREAHRAAGPQLEHAQAQRRARAHRRGGQGGAPEQRDGGYAGGEPAAGSRRTGARESVGWVKRSADPTPFAQNGFVLGRRCRSTQPILLLIVRAKSHGERLACKSTTSSASAMPSSTSSPAATTRSWRGTAAARAACSWSMRPRCPSSTTTWGRPSRSPAARSPTPWSGIASFGGRAGFIGKTADDQFGQIFGHDIRTAGVTFTTPPARQGQRAHRPLPGPGDAGRPAHHEHVSGRQPAARRRRGGCRADTLGAHRLSGGLSVRPPGSQGGLPAGGRDRRQGRPAGGA